MATSISENASETIKKFCTVRSGRNVNTERITRILPNRHKTTILERTRATGNAVVNDNGSIVVARVEFTNVAVNSDALDILVSLS